MANQKEFETAKAEKALAALIKKSHREFYGKSHICESVRVLEYDEKKQEATVKPTIRQDYDGGDTEELPPIPNLPVSFPAGGGFSITWPIDRGDTGVVHVFTRPVVEWLNSGQNINESGPYRRFNVNDSYVWTGLQPWTDPLSMASKDKLVIAAEDGSMKIELNRSSGNIRVENTGGSDIVLEPNDGDVKNGSAATEALAIASSVQSEINKLWNHYLGHKHDSGGGPTTPPNGLIPSVLNGLEQPSTSPDPAGDVDAENSKDSKA